MDQIEIAIPTQWACHFDEAFWRFVTVELSDRPSISTRMSSYPLSDALQCRVVAMSDRHMLEAFSLFWRSTRFGYERLAIRPNETSSHD